MQLVLPKVRRDGKFKMTAIGAESITGFEPADIKYNGKTHKGVKCYTPSGSFKVLCAPVMLAKAKAQAALAPADTTLFLEPLADLSKVLKKDDMKMLAVSFNAEK